MRIETIRELSTNRAEIDYGFLMSALQGYVRPREKISRWLKSGELIRVKKGLYVFGKSIAQSGYSKEVLANLIYGPSAISLHYALAFYGFIPETVTSVTSITPKRYKTYQTPVGDFVYHYLNFKKYSIGIALETILSNQQILIASPEKALCDLIHLIDKKIQFSQLSDVDFYLFHDLRMDPTLCKEFSIKTLEQLSTAYQDTRLDQLTLFIKKWKK